MSDASAPPAANRIRGEHILIGVVLALVLATLYYVSSQSQQVLRRSPAGLDGLQIWLSSEGQSAQTFTGGWPIDQNGVGLLVVPLYDTDPGGQRDWPQTQEELLLQQDEYDLQLRDIVSKRGNVPTLVVLPKWRSGLRLTGIGHPVLLVEQARADRLVRRLTGDKAGAVMLSSVPFTRFDGPAGDGLRAEIYAAQMIRAPGCTPVIGREDAMLLARCPIKRVGDGPGDFLLLSDPDLLNNHGLRLGDNARIVSALIAEQAGDRNIVIDYSTRNWLFDASRGVQRERSWSDLAQFFAPPFTLLWAAGALTLGLVLWRAAVRFGPVMGAVSRMGASKIQAVAARARTMRLSDQDGAMLGDYARVRIATLGAQTFGPAHARHYASEEAFMRYVKQRHPDHATALAGALNALRGLPHRMSANRALAQVDELERVLERIANDT